MAQLQVLMFSGSTTLCQVWLIHSNHLNGALWMGQLDLAECMVVSEQAWLGAGVSEGM